MQSRSEQPVVRERRRRCPEELRWSCPMQPFLPSVLRQGRLAHLLDTSACNADCCDRACGTTVEFLDERFKLAAEPGVEPLVGFDG